MIFTVMWKRLTIRIDKQKERTRMAERIKHVIGSAKGKVYAAILALVLLALLCAGGYVLWLYSQPRFHGLTLELGSELPEVGAFLTEYAKPEKAQLITEQADIDMTLVGNQTLTFQHGRRTETVTLTIVDTTAPMAVFCDVTARIDQVPAPEDFVEEVLDLSEVTVAFAQELTVPESYGDVSVEIVVEDAYGNATTGQCKLFYVWLRPSYTLELGDQLKKSDLLLDADKDAALISQAVLNKINNSSIGTYMVTSKAGDYVCECVVTVQDTTAPVLVLKEAWVPVG